MYFQRKKDHDDDNVALDCKFRLLTIILDECMFQELRAKKQLGYAISAKYLNTNGIHGISLCITSADYSPIRLQKEILEFLDRFKLTKTMFDSYCKGLVTTKKDGFSSMPVEASYFTKQLIKFSTTSDQIIQWDTLE